MNDRRVNMNHTHSEQNIEEDQETFTHLRAAVHHDLMH